MFMEDKAKKVSLEMKPSTGKRADGESEKLLAKVVDLEDAEESQAGSEIFCGPSAGTIPSR